MEVKTIEHTDVVLIGAGVMSATLGVLLNELMPGVRITVFEKLDKIAGESSDAWNNAGTGHSAFCELNYSPEDAQGNIDIHKALHITESFELSRQFWSYLVQNGKIPVSDAFIHSVPHMSFVWGDKNVDYLRRRYEAMKSHHFYESMQYSEDTAQLAEWMPLVMHGRKAGEKAAATRIEIGTDVNFGALTRALFAYLQTQNNVHVHLEHKVKDIDRHNDIWVVDVRDEHTGHHRKVACKFVFIGAGGGALKLLEKTHIPESNGYGGFPVSGQWLKCNNPEVIARHHAKVYGKASVGAPPMSVPHLDTRIIDGRRELLFGPYAGFSTKFLKEGSYLDLPRSLTWDNLMPMIDAGLHNIPLTRYLVQQVLQSDDDRMAELREYLPEARSEDWELKIAGQRVQVIKKDAKEGGVLEFGTEVVTATDGSVAALLGASPGASTAVAIMLQLLGTCFEAHMQSQEWQDKLKEMIPSYGQSLAADAALTRQVREQTAKTLGLVNK